MATTFTPPRFLPWALVFAFTRAGDLWSTSLFMLQPGGAAGEMNPLTSVLGLSYWPLTVVNILFSALLLYGHWHYCTYFGQRTLPGVPSSRSDYVSLLFFGRTGQAWKALYTEERNKCLHYSQLAHVLVMTLACVSVLAVTHNLGQVYGWRLNDLTREFLVRPSLVYYGLCLPLVVFFALRMMDREFRMWRQKTSVRA
ncbi:MAG: hypothetical protein JNL52_00180 [Flavobacteriales bacterium]|nr:hypothetical protein [Flavobacteriales bacterium]